MSTEEFEEYQHPPETELSKLVCIATRKNKYSDLEDCLQVCIKFKWNHLRQVHMIHPYISDQLLLRNIRQLKCQKVDLQTVCFKD